MNKKIINIMLIITLQQCGHTIFAISNAFIKPPPDRKYHEVCWLSSHNAYATRSEYPLYYNQSLSLKDQLAYGVRAFEIDTYYRCWESKTKIGPIKSGSQGCNVSVCHGDCESVNRAIYKPHKQLVGVQALDFVTDILKVFKEFLEKNPQEIITFTLENYVDQAHKAPADFLDQQFEKAKIEKFILKPTDWNPSKDGWPTLDWMIKNNKRLVIFNDVSPQSEGYNTQLFFQSTKYTYYQWACVVQNQWGSAKDLQKALTERGGSKAYRSTTRYLLELDWFPDGATPLDSTVAKLINTFGGIFGKDKEIPFGGDFKVLNSAPLESFLKQVRNNGLESGAAKGRAPNFIKVDEVHKGKAMDFVNKINQEAADPAKRAALFAPMSI